MFKVITMKIYQRAAFNSTHRPKLLIYYHKFNHAFIILCLFGEPYLAVLDLVSRFFVGAKLRTLYIQKTLISPVQGIMESLAQFTVLPYTV